MELFLGMVALVQPQLFLGHLSLKLAVVVEVGQPALQLEPAALAVAVMVAQILLVLLQLRTLAVAAVADREIQILALLVAQAALVS